MSVFKNILEMPNNLNGPPNETVGAVMKTWRGFQWLAFQAEVLDHIENYTVPQYGDMPNDQASSFSMEEIAMNMKRYVNRMGTGARGKEEAKRDMLKIAHYACMAYAKMMEAEDD